MTVFAAESTARVRIVELYMPRIPLNTSADPSCPSFWRFSTAQAAWLALRIFADADAQRMSSKTIVRSQKAMNDDVELGFPCG